MTITISTTCTIHDGPGEPIGIIEQVEPVEQDLPIYHLKAIKIVLFTKKTNTSLENRNLIIHEEIVLPNGVTVRNTIYHVTLNPKSIETTFKKISNDIVICESLLFDISKVEDGMENENEKTV